MYVFGVFLVRISSRNWMSENMDKRNSEYGHFSSSDLGNCPDKAASYKLLSYIKNSLFGKIS